MRPGKERPEEQAIKRVEALLRASAAFEPEEGAPEDLVARALARRDGTARCGGWPWPRLVLATGMAAAAVAILFLIARGAGTSQQIAKLPPTPHLTPVSPEHPPVPQRIERQSPAPPQATASLSSGTIQSAGYAPRHPLRRHGHRRPVVPKARWEEETVQHYESGVIASAWLAERDEEHGDVVLTPVVVDMPLQGGTVIHPAGYSEESE